ncbi:MAG: TetR/AcrR family transcriptional regulator [Caldilineaceae bacterium]|nr:TetR/AcrR family transcriptional regulator [Caldilineaceae bacterium]
MLTVEQPPTQATPSKEAVLDAAQRLIHQYGYTGFSMRDLAQESGLAKATIYHHFQDKREIFLQVLERDLITVRDRITAAAATPGDLQTRLRALITAFFELATERGALLISTLRQAEGMECEIYHLMRRYRDELYRPVVELLADAVADGSIRPLDLELTTVSFYGIIQGFTSRHLLTADLELDEKATDFILDLLLNGLLSPPSTAQ